MGNADIAFLSKQLRDLAADSVSRKSPLVMANVLLREALKRGAFDDVRLSEFRHIYSIGRGELTTTATALAWLSNNAGRVSLPYPSNPMPDILKGMAGSTLPAREIIGPHLLAVADLLDVLAGNSTVETTPGYPRPDEISLSKAIDEMLTIVAHFGSDVDIWDHVLIRAAIHRGYTPGQGMWAVHELIQRGVIIAATLEARDRKRYLVSKDNPPSGIVLADGTMHFGGGITSWGHMVFVIDHRRIIEVNHRPALATNDTPRDISGKSQKKRGMNAAAISCVRLYKKARRADPTVPMKAIVTDYVAENGGSVSSIVRILNDNPDQWKDDTKTT